MVLLSTEFHNDEGENSPVRLGLLRLAVTGHPYSSFLVKTEVPTTMHTLNCSWFCWTTTLLPLVGTLGPYVMARPSPVRPLASLSIISRTLYRWLAQQLRNQPYLLLQWSSKFMAPYSGPLTCRYVRTFAIHMPTFNFSQPRPRHPLPRRSQRPCDYGPAPVPGRVVAIMTSL